MRYFGFLFTLIPWLWSCFFWTFSISPAYAQTISSGELQQVQQGYEILQRSLSEFPAATENGSVTVNGQLYRSWNAGDTPDQYMTLGDFESAGFVDLSIQQIAQLENVDLKEISLANFLNLLPYELDVEGLVELDPQIKNLPLAKLAPLLVLVRSFQAGWTPDDPSLLQQPLEELLNKYPALRLLKLNDLKNITDYAISSIPGLASVLLGDLPNWQELPIYKVPGLGDLPIHQYPGINPPFNPDHINNPINSGNSPIQIPTLPFDPFTFVMRLDMVYNVAEGRNTSPTISGSNVQGWSVPCKPQEGRKDCANIELISPLKPKDSKCNSYICKQWISGRYQKVKGGSGVFKGYEPTGRMLIPNLPFKVVMWEPNETADKVSFRLFTRLCFKLGCTPYNIGPFPWLSFKVGDLIPVGMPIDHTPGSTPSKPTHRRAPYEGRDPGKIGWLPAPTRYADSREDDTYSTIGGITDCVVTNTDNPTSTPGDGASSPTPSNAQGIDMNAYAEAIKRIESSGGTNIIGSFTCDDAGNCGRGLGDYQFMSYDDYATPYIDQKPGGRAWRQKIARGYRPTEEEVLHYFPREEQRKALEQSVRDRLRIAQRQIDPTTGKPFTGDRLIERIAQMHFGGSGSRIDGGGTDTHNTSIRDYGKKVLAGYKGGGGKACQPTDAAPATCQGTGKGEYRYPLPRRYPVTSEFGWRFHPIRQERRFHAGIDLGAGSGVPVLAADGCKVTTARNTGGYGLTVIIDHGNGYRTLYAHLSRINVQEGQTVGKGQVIGAVGSTGLSTGPHLHFETHRNGTPVNPRSQGINF